MDFQISYTNLNRGKVRKIEKESGKERERERERKKERKKERKGTIGYDLKWSKLSSYLVHLVQWDEGKEGTEE